MIGGLAGGVVFGALMQMMGMISMVASLVGSESVAVGWLIHLVISAFAGAVFALLLASRAEKYGPAVLLGLVYGVAWWVVGALQKQLRLSSANSPAAPTMARHSLGFRPTVSQDTDARTSIAVWWRSRSAHRAKDVQTGRW